MSWPHPVQITNRTSVRASMAAYSEPYRRSVPELKKKTWRRSPSPSQEEASAQGFMGAENSPFTTRSEGFLDKIGRSTYRRRNSGNARLAPATATMAAMIPMSRPRLDFLGGGGGGVGVGEGDVGVGGPAAETRLMYLWKKAMVPSSTVSPLGRSADVWSSRHRAWHCPCTRTCSAVMPSALSLSTIWGRAALSPMPEWILAARGRGERGS